MLMCMLRLIANACKRSPRCLSHIAQGYTVPGLAVLDYCLYGQKYLTYFIAPQMVRDNDGWHRSHACCVPNAQQRTHAFYAFIGQIVRRLGAVVVGGEK